MNNTFLINAPAGSGKTTKIRNMLKAITMENPAFKVLCITYTNRAADELKKDLDNSNITVCTIHSYINDLISPFFSESSVIELYWAIFGSKIEERIANIANDERINSSNNHYLEKYGNLSRETVKENLTCLSYGETPFTSLYTGKLSHDDLLMFAYKLIEKHPIILRKIYSKFNYIFIDEYQDTSAYVLKLFYKAVKDKNNVSLYLLGDRMQQIYQNYDGSFEAEFKTFDFTEKLDINHRSVPNIISILNKIYNDKDYNQKASAANLELKPEISPQVIITKEPKRAVKILQDSYPEILTLYLMNREKYEEIGAARLYTCFNNMETYSFGRKYSPADVLSDLSDDNPDPLMKLLFLIFTIAQLYKNENFGSIISKCKKQNKYFNAYIFKIKKHADKAILKEKLDKLAKIYYDNQSTIKNVLDKLCELELIKSETLKDLVENPEYTTVFDVPISEVDNLAKYLNTPTISTQHGVKGESHTSVIFVANNSNTTPNVRMYEFFELWSTVNFSLTEFEEFYYSYLSDIKEIESQIGMKISDLRRETHLVNIAIIKKACTLALEKYKNSIFESICKDDIDTYISNSTLNNAKKLFKKTTIEGILTAYKLFYVGCSRARKNLLVVVDESKIKNYREKFIKKCEDVGFEVKTDSIEE